jgi:hypothetical protein
MAMIDDQRFISFRSSFSPRRQFLCVYMCVWSVFVWSSVGVGVGVVEEKTRMTSRAERSLAPHHSGGGSEFTKA